MPKPAARTTARAARLYITAQAECGHLCPMTMTSASVAALTPIRRRSAENWAAAHPLPAIRPARRGRSARRPGITIGMGMTEKQGGSDVAPTPRQAERQPRRFLAHHRPQMVPLGADVRTPSWCSPRRAKGLTCFLMPRFLPDGTRNATAAACASRTSSATAPTPPPRSNSTGRRLARRRARRRRADHHRHGDADPARLRRRLRRPHARRPRRSRPPCPPSQGVRPHAARPAADDARPRRHGARRRGGGGARPPAGANPSTAPPTDRARPPLPG